MKEFAVIEAKKSFSAAYQDTLHQNGIAL